MNWNMGIVMSYCLHAICYLIENHPENQRVLHVCGGLCGCVCVFAFEQFEAEAQHCSA